MARTEPHIFISYAGLNIDIARKLRAWLLQEGHSPWMDLFDIPAGARWPDAIDRALRASETVIGLMSPASIASENVKNEWDWAIANDRRLILLLIDPCEIPFHYVSRNYIDFAGDRESGYQALAAALIDRQQATPTDTDSDTTGDGDGSSFSHLAHVPDTGAVSARGSRLRRALRRQTSVPTMVGRERERAALQRQLDRAAESEGGLVLLGGEAGIGKTTIACWLRALATDRHMLALTGGCYDLTTTPPYGPWVEILQGYDPQDELPPVPDVIRDESKLAAIASEAALFELVGEFFAEVSEHQPLLLILEDLHWADPASLSFLRFFARFLSGLPVLIVATFRDDELTRHHSLFELMPLLIRESGAHRLLLERLDDAAVRELVAERYPLDSEDTGRLVDYLQQFANGNPFFTRELLESLAEQGRLVREGDGWRLRPLDDVRVRRLVREVIESRLSRLDEEEREALEIAAIIGQSVPLELWTTISGLPERELSRALERAAGLHVLTDDTGPDEIAFSHALMRETLYDSIVTLRRRELHRQVAEALTELPGADPDAVAHHYRQCGDQRTVEWLLRAALRAERRYSWIMASDRYETAFQMVEGDEERLPEQGWLLFHAGRLMTIGSRRQAHHYLERAREIAQQTQDRLLAASSQFVIGLCHNIDGQFALGIEEQRQAIEVLDEFADDKNLDWGHAANWRPAYEMDRGSPLSESLSQLDTGRSWTHAAMWADAAGRFKLAEKFHQRVAVTISSGLQSGADESARALRYLVEGDINTARQMIDRGVSEIIRDQAYVQAAVRLIDQLAGLNLPFLTEDVEARRDLIASIAEYQTRSAGVYGNLRPSITYTHIGLFYEGDWQAAEQIALDGIHPNASGNYYPLARTTLAQIARHRGDLETAWKHVRAIFPEPEAAQPGDSNYIFSLYLLRTAIEIALDCNDLEEARRWLTTYGEWLDWADAVLGRAEEELLWARYYQIDGQLEPAQEHANRALERATGPRQPLALIAIHRLLGALDREADHHEAAERHLEQSRQLAELCELPFEGALTLIEFTRLHAITGDHAEAQCRLDEARGICDPLRANAALEQITQIEARLGTDR